MAAETLSVEVLDKGFYSTAKDASVTLVESTASLVGAWEKVRPGSRNVPAVDFSKEAVVVAFMGPRPTSGYSVAPGALKVEGDTVVVPVVYDCPPEDAMTLQVVTSPYTIFKLKRPSGSSLKLQVEDCPGE